MLGVPRSNYLLMAQTFVNLEQAVGSGEHDIRGPFLVKGAESNRGPRGGAQLKHHLPLHLALPENRGLLNPPLRSQASFRKLWVPRQLCKAPSFVWNAFQARRSSKILGLRVYVGRQVGYLWSYHQKTIL